MPGSTESAMLQMISDNLGVNQLDLSRLIQFESKWNPKASNYLSTARGLLQWTDKTARSLGFSDSIDLVKKNPTVIDQLPIVERYLSRFKPFSGKQSLYMSVFYPAARFWSKTTRFPQSVIDANPGIKTPADYINKVEGKGGNGFLSALALLAFFLYLKLR